MKPLYAYACVITLILFATRISNSEFYSASAELEKLLHTEGEIVSSLEKYLNIEEKRLAKLKRLTEQYNELYKTAHGNGETFFSNPVNAYVLLKRLTADWEIVNQLVEDFEGQAVIYDTSDMHDLPSEEDLRGAAEALLRLQKVYLLDTTALANGQIKGANATTNLMANDCFELGRQAYDKGYHKYAVSWLKEALHRLEKEELPTTKKIDVFESLASTYFSLENYTAAIALTEQITRLDPYHSRAPHNLMRYRIHAANMEYKMNGEEDSNQEKSEEEEINETETLKAYEKLCRGESIKTPEENSKLNCYSTTNDNNYLLLQPAKVEVLNLNPRIILFHDVVRESEANVMKSLAFPKLKRATVGASGKKVADYRVSKTAWIRDNENDISIRLNRRIEDLTGLDTKYAEKLHVINYGIGGQYEPHLDFASKGETVDSFQGTKNRIATWIFYLSHVIAGGSTVFPNIGVEVKPVKGAAVFWYNLLRNGHGDRRTVHAGCPVLSGSKWVWTKWIHGLGNEFKRPCTLRESE